MDAPTADNEVVLASLGGKPRIPADKIEGDNSGSGHSDTNKSSDDTINAADEDKRSAAERGVPREGLRERAGNWNGA